MACCADSAMAAVVLSMLLLLRCAVPTVSAPPLKGTTSVCQGGVMSLYLSKAEFADLPFSIYVDDEHSGYYQAAAVAKQCHYFLGESATQAVLAVPLHGCFVRTQKYTTTLTVVITALGDKRHIEIVKRIRLTCERTNKALSKNNHLLVSRNTFCSKDGFNITINPDATSPPLNLDSIWIPSNQSWCKPQKSSKEAITFIFPFNYCGSQFKIANGIITYWVNIEEKRHPQREDTPFRFVLTETARLDLGVHREATPSTLRSEGSLRIQMRFAKDTSYKSFHSTHGPPLMTGLGQPVYVEVFVVKHENKDLKLLLEDCWATPTENPNDLQRWNLIVKGCPFSGDSHRTVMLPVVSSKELKFPSLHKRFEVKMFSFVKPKEDANRVYFHCNVKLCTGFDCSQPCSNGKRKLRTVVSELRQSVDHSVISGGPVIFTT